MKQDSIKSPLGVEGLFCPEALRASVRLHSGATEAREGIKELLGGQAPKVAKKIEENSDDICHWQRSLNLLLEDFLARKGELLRLNKARKNQIESYLRLENGDSVSLEAAVSSRMGSQEHEALLLFAHQVCVFFLLQLLLLKRWCDLGLLAESSDANHSLNWRITSFLKKHSPKGLLGRHEWSFLKQNLFSWFAPTKETQEHIRLLLASINLSKENEEFPSKLLTRLGKSSRLSLLGFSPQMADSSALWRLLLQKRADDLAVEAPVAWDFSSENSSPVLVSGLRNGECLSSLRDLADRREITGVWAFTDSEFERYLAEMFLLWDSENGIPKINLFPRTILKDLSKDAVKTASLFSDGQRTPYQAQLGACFQSEGGVELEDATHLLEQLKENGLLLLVSSRFWPTEQDPECERLRELILKKASVRLIIDLRQLVGSEACSLPKGVFLLEKCSSKEVRDSNRPQILRARGKLNPSDTSSFWNAVIENVRQDTLPGEVTAKNLHSTCDNLKIEVMGAAASQHELRASPWITLSDPAFFQASGRLKRSPSRAHNFCTLLRWKPEMPIPSPRALLLHEKGRNLFATQSGESYTDGSQFLLVPEQTVIESPDFWLAQIHSAPIQFWHALELEQRNGRSQKQAERQNEQRLKMMPLVRIFEPNTLLPLSSSDTGSISLEEADAQLKGLFRKNIFGISERVRLHQLVLSLERSCRQNLSVCVDFTKHLFPSLTLSRLELPTLLPEVSPKVALEIFKHLDQSSLIQHPSIHLTRIRPSLDFKVTNVQYDELTSGAIGDLKVFHGGDLVVKLSGPSLLLKSTYEIFAQRTGRSWRELSESIKLPTDFLLMQTQLKEVVKSIDNQLKLTRGYQGLLDQTFCRLMGLCSDFEDTSVRLAMRRHLSPEESRLTLTFNKPEPKSFTAIDFAGSKEVLQ